MANVKTVTGRVDDLPISRHIECFQSNIPEQILTLKREICDEFVRLGFKREQVVFDDE